jgi:hypothetical protein
MLYFPLQTWEDDNVEKMGPPQDYRRLPSSFRAFAGLGLVTSAPAFYNKTDSRKIKVARGPKSSTVSSRIEYDAHKPEDYLESAPAASLTGGGVGSSTGGGVTANMSNAAVFPSERASLEELTKQCKTPRQVTLRSKADRFLDVTMFPFISGASDPMASSSIGAASKQLTATSNSTSFPEALHDLLEMANWEQLDVIVNWLPHKHAFWVNSKDRSMQEILPCTARAEPEELLEAAEPVRLFALPRRPTTAPTIPPHRPGHGKGKQTE